MNQLNYTNTVILDVVQTIVMAEVLYG